jgi:hypothetical protein
LIGPTVKLIGLGVKIETMLYTRNPCLQEILANKWGVLNSTIPVQDKPDQVHLIVQNIEIAKTLNNRQTMETTKTPNNRYNTEIAKTLNNGLKEEDLLIESAMHKEASQ